MKSFKSIGLAVALSCASALAQTTIPTYATFSSAEGTSSAKVIIPQKATSQIRLVSIVAQSDKATSLVKLYSGTTARYVAVADTNISDTIMLLDGTNGLAASALLYVQGASSNVVATVSSFTTTNVWSGVGTITNTSLGYVVLSAGIGIPQTVNAEVEVLQTTPTQFSLGAKTNNVWGSDALFVGNYGRAVYVTLDGTSDCLLNAVTAHYDSSSQ